MLICGNVWVEMMSHSKCNFHHQHGFNTACCDCNCLDYSNVDLIFMEYFWQEQALHLLFVLVNIYLMVLDGVQMSIGRKT